MSPLEFLILCSIHAHGPQSDMSLWEQTKCQSLTAVAIATATLNDRGFIQGTPSHQPTRYVTTNEVTYWQLTAAGLQLVAGNKAQQEVSLGSH